MRSPLDRLIGVAGNMVPVAVSDDVRRWLVAFAGKLGLSQGEAAGEVLRMAAQGGGF